MSELSKAYLLADHIFNTVWQQNEILNSRDLYGRDICVSRGHMTNSYQVLAFGNRNDTSEPVWEVLTQRKDGNYQLQATPCLAYTGDPDLLRRIIITPESPDEHTLRLASSMMVRELACIAIELVFPNYSQDNKKAL